MPRVSKRNRKGTAPKKPKIKYYRTAIYIRLSRKDGGHGRKDSIYIQKQICTDFVKKHPEMLLTKVYIDNGVTGTTFERDAFEELMDDVRAGRIDCIVVKDLSRFGRDTITMQNNIEKVFPFLQVRILGSIPPNGYLFSDDGNRTLVLNQETAPIVRYIFDRRLAKAGYSEIARELEAKGIPCPYVYLTSKGYACRGKRDIKKLWNRDALYNILTNPVYTGVMVNHKTETITPSGKCRIIPENERIYVEGNHETIVTKAEFEQVAAMIIHNDPRFGARIKNDICSLEREDVDTATGLCGCVQSTKGQR